MCKSAGIRIYGFVKYNSFEFLTKHWKLTVKKGVEYNIRYIVSKYDAKKSFLIIHIFLSKRFFCSEANMAELDLSYNWWKFTRFI